MRRPILNEAGFGDAAPMFRDDLGRPVRTSIVDDDDFVRDVMKSQFDMQMFDRRCDAAFFIASGYHDRQQSQWCF